MVRQDFERYARATLRDSLVTGLPQIVAAGSTPKKVVRALVFMLCLAGFVYQSIRFMNLYWSFGVVMDIQVSTPQYIERPGFTVCNVNGLQMSRVCESEQCDEVEDEEQLCMCRPRYCENGMMFPNITFPRRLRLKKLSLRAQEENANFLQPNKSLIDKYYEYATFPGSRYTYLKVSDSLVSMRSPTNLGATAVCYSGNTIIGHPEKIVSQISTEGVPHIILRVNPEEYDPALGQTYLQIAFHNPREVVNPFVTGTVLFSGSNYNMRIRKEVTVRLPPPYETRCVDYLAHWEARGGQGPTTEKDCMQECRKNASLWVLGCVTNDIDIPFNERICDVEHPGGDYPEQQVASLTNECVAQHCGPACWEEKYELKVQRSEKISNPLCWEEKKSKDEVMYIFLFLSGIEVTTYTYKPQFQSIETFSYLGGYVGMWLGISLIAVFDFLEALVALLKYPLRRYDAHRGGTSR